jgi:hypothetical protein
MSDEKAKEREGNGQRGGFSKRYKEDVGLAEGSERSEGVALCPFCLVVAAATGLLLFW